MTATPYLLSVNVGEIREVIWNGEIITTGIYKSATLGKMKVEGVKIDGDHQADPKNHGGEYQAIYGYPHEHYEFWKKRYPQLEFHTGMFGENLTTTGILENDLYVGDRLCIGDVELIAVLPRSPCYKLGIKFGDQGIIKQMEEAENVGYYCKIAKEGEIETGQDIELVRNDDPLLTIVDVFRIKRNKASKEMLEKAVVEPHLPDQLKQRVQMYLNGL